MVASINHRPIPPRALWRDGLGEGNVPSSGPEGALRWPGGGDGTHLGSHLRASRSSASECGKGNKGLAEILGLHPGSSLPSHVTLSKPIIHLASTSSS